MIEMTIDHVGPMANSTEGLAKLMTAIAGFDPLDPRQYGRVSPEFKPDYMPALTKGVRGLRIGVVREGFKQDGSEFGLQASEPEVDERVMGAIAQLRSLGAEVEEISIPYHLESYAIWSAIALEGAAAFMLKGYGAGTNWQGYYNSGLSEALARGFKSHAHDLAATVKSVLLRGEYFRKQYNGRYYNKAQNLRHLVSEAYDKALGTFDILAMPTTPGRATKMVDRYASTTDTVTSALNMLRNTVTADLTGHPSISIPCGMHDGLPIGLMLTAGQLKDDVLIAASAAFEKLGDWKRM
jgi:amidase